MTARDALIVALDVENVEAARALVEKLGRSVGFYKIGLELAFAGGLDFAEGLKDAGKRVFLDLKLHDIGATVERATRQIARRGVDFLTVHGYEQTMRAARDGAGESGLRILAVTVLTSYDDVDLRKAGYAQDVAATVASRAAQAREAGLAGLILSPLDLRPIRALAGPKMLLVTPGVRPRGGAAARFPLERDRSSDDKSRESQDAGANSDRKSLSTFAEFALDDQKRVASPAEAIEAGADYLVVGRPITRAEDPRRAAEAIVAEIEEAAARI